jgi:hypothetical protein
MTVYSQAAWMVVATTARASRMAVVASGRRKWPGRRTRRRRGRSGRKPRGPVQREIERNTFLFLMVGP